MDFYDSLNDFESEIIKSRSRFIGRVYHIKDETHALDILKSIKKEFSDATHICYGYVADIYGLQRYSDGGEPAGTAGRPIIDALLKRELKQVLAVVIRYFGGIKLGAGGLTRAYGECINGAIEGAERLRFALCAVYKVTMDFLTAKRLKNCLESGKILEAQYLEMVTMRIAIPVSCAAGFESTLADISGGRAEAEGLCESYIAM